MATKDIEVGDWEIGMEVTERENERELFEGDDFIMGIVVTPTAMDAIAGTSLFCQQDKKRNVFCSSIHQSQVLSYIPTR